MTVKELIAQLQELPPDAKVCIYEADWGDSDLVEATEVRVWHKGEAIIRQVENDQPAPEVDVSWARCVPDRWLTSGGYKTGATDA